MYPYITRYWTSIDRIILLKLKPGSYGNELCEEKFYILGSYLYI